MSDRLSPEFYYMLPFINVTLFVIFGLIVTSIIKIYEWRNKNGNTKRSNRIKFRERNR